MRKKDEEVIKKVVDKIIDSKVLLTGDGDFCVETLRNEICRIIIRNLFSKESSIDEIQIDVCGSHFGYENDEYRELLVKSYRIILYKQVGLCDRTLFNEGCSDLAKSPSFKRLVEYIEENKHLILHNDKEYGRSHTLTDTDFI
jgi:hypothetical protein